MTNAVFGECRDCHAEVAGRVMVCPACGGAVLADGKRDFEVAPQTVDHRGIVLPRRHAVGGIITPR